MEALLEGETNALVIYQMLLPYLIKLYQTLSLQDFTMMVVN